MEGNCSGEHTADQDSNEKLTKKLACTGGKKEKKRRQVAGSATGRGGIYLVAGGTVARRPQQRQWLSQRPLDGPE